jgi:small-conductance mechanosensitive channel
VNLFDAAVGVAFGDGLIATGILVAVVIVALLLEKLAYRALLAVERRSENGLFAVMLRHVEGPASIAVPLLAALIAVPELRFPPQLDRELLRAVSIATIVAIGWGIVAAIGLAGDILKRRYDIDTTDNLQARRVATRIDILSRTLITLVVLISTALAAMTFPAIRVLGTTLLASAGVAGLIIGLAARPLFENLVAGVQIALSQPIRIDDAVEVEGEFGHVEEIAATYVVVRLWDRRRMVLPLTYFIQKPFENWTRTSSSVIGAVLLYAVYGLPVEELRNAVRAILADDPRWDGEVQSVQVVDVTETAQQLRVLVSARDAESLFDLRCVVREKLVAWLSAHYPRPPQA